MNNSEKLVSAITQKDEKVALTAAEQMINNADISAFEILNNKSEFLFDFVKNNVRKRLSNAISENNYKNIFKFLAVYSFEYADVLMAAVAKFADDTDVLDFKSLLSKGTDIQKAYSVRFFTFSGIDSVVGLLLENAFSDFEPLMLYVAEALGVAKEKSSYEKALNMLESADDFEVLKATKFLVSYADKNAITPIFNSFKKSNIKGSMAQEIPFLMTFDELIRNNKTDICVACLSEIINELAEVIPLSQVFVYDIYNILDNLLKINKKNNHNFSEIATVLAKAKLKFELICNHDEYIFDTDKNTKNELSEILNLLTSYPKDYWETQYTMMTDELYSDKNKILSALEVIRDLKLVRAIDDVLNVVNNEDETVVCSAVQTLKELSSLDRVDKSVAERIHNENLKTIILSYFN